MSEMHDRDGGKPVRDRRTLVEMSLELLTLGHRYGNQTCEPLRVDIATWLRANAEDLAALVAAEPKTLRELAEDLEADIRRCNTASPAFVAYHWLREHRDQIARAK
jgi:hypothetical protein